MSRENQKDSADGDTTHFGYEQVPTGDKRRRVAGVFTSVAHKYDLMNDLMSMGVQRVWKRFAIDLAGVRAGERGLDVAGGNGGLWREFAKAARSEEGRVGKGCGSTGRSRWSPDQRKKKKKPRMNEP